MGFQRDHAERALSLTLTSNNSFDRAIDILVAEQAQEDRIEEEKKQSQSQNQEMKNDEKEENKDEEV